MEQNELKRAVVEAVNALEDNPQEQRIAAVVFEEGQLKMLGYIVRCERTK